MYIRTNYQKLICLGLVSITLEIFSNFFCHIWSGVSQKVTPCDICWLWISATLNQLHQSTAGFFSPIAPPAPPHLPYMPICDLKVCMWEDMWAACPTCTHAIHVVPLTVPHAHPLASCPLSLLPTHSPVSLSHSRYFDPGPGCGRCGWRVGVCDKGISWWSCVQAQVGVGPPPHLCCWGHWGVWWACRGKPEGGFSVESSSLFKWV